MTTFINLIGFFLMPQHDIRQIMHKRKETISKSPDTVEFELKLGEAKCQSCGVFLNDNANFCSQCGSKIEASK